MERIDVRITNWKKYNPRGDVKKSSWLRIEYKIADSESLFDLSFEERWAFLSLCCLSVERESRGHISCRTDWFASKYKLSKAAVESAVRKLVAAGTLETVARPAAERSRNADVTPTEQGRNSPDTDTNADVTTRDETRRYDTKEDLIKTNTICSPARAGERREGDFEETGGEKEKPPDTTPSPPKVVLRLDFKSVYSAHYPNRVGRGRGISQCRKQIRTLTQFEAWKLAMKNYAAYQALPLSKGEFRPKPRQFDRFMADGYWQDWIDPPPEIKARLDEEAARKAPANAASPPPTPPTEPVIPLSVEQIQSDLAEMELEAKQGGGVGNILPIYQRIMETRMRQHQEARA